MSIKLTAQQKKQPIYTAQDIWSIIQPIYMRENRQRRKKEYFWALGIDKERHLKFAELLALGGENRVHIKPADAFRMAIYKETDYVIFIHNHPTGKLQPSPEDKDATDRLIKAGEVVDIKVADHFIISETKYFSFAEAGLMKELRNSSTYRVLHEDEVELLKLQFAAEGRLDEKEQMALKMLAAGEPIQKIVAYTGLKKAAVRKLAKEGK